MPVLNSGYIRNRDSSEVNNNGHDLENMKFQLDTWEFFTTVVGQAWKEWGILCPWGLPKLKITKSQNNLSWKEPLNISLYLA